jgi:KaiC domain protein
VTDDGDWFERALRDDRSVGAEPAGGDDTESEAGDDSAVDGDGDDGDPPWASSDDGTGSAGLDAGTDASDDGSGGAAAPGRVESAGGGKEPDGPSAPDAGGEPFGQDFANAFENAPSPGGGEGTADAGGTSGAFDGGGGTGPGSGTDAGSGQISGDDFGFGGLDGTDDSGTGSFDDEEFESDIPRIAVGVEGLDEMIIGGVPERSLIAAIGSAGTGKTTLGLQFLHEALRSEGNAVYITLEESREAVLSTAEEKGWPFREYVDEGRLSVVAMDPVEMANSLATIRSELPRLIDEFDADRVVLDSVSLLEMMYDRPSDRRSEVFDFARSLKGVGVTTLLTSEASEESPYASRYGIVEYLTDAVFVLQYVRSSGFEQTRLAVEIQKIRDANHSREAKPYEITDDGISVHRQANIF